MTTTPDFGLPELSQSQANPDVTHNEALQLLQALSNGAIDRALNNPPGAPTNGDVYILGAAPTGAWAGRANAVAVYLGGAWHFIPGFDSAGAAIAIGARHEGLSLYVRDEDLFYTWSGAAWVISSVVADGDKGDITVSGSGLTWTIDNNAVSNAKLRDSAALSVIGRSANSLGDPADIVGADGQVLRVAGTTLAFGTIADAAVPTNTLSLSKLVDASAQFNIIGRSTAGAGSWEQKATSSDVFAMLGAANNAAILTAIGAASLGANTFTAIQTIDPGANAGLTVRRTDGNFSGGTINLTKALGTVGAETVITTGYESGRINFLYYDGAAYQTAGRIFNRVTAATPSSTDGQSQYEVQACVAGSVVPTNFSIFSMSTGLSLFNGNVVIDQNRHFRKRIYTIATLPTAAVSSEEIACSDLGGGAGTLESTGASSAWRRRTPGYQTLGDSTETITPLTHAEFLNVTSALTAARTKTLSNTRAYAGARFHIKRTGLGAFNLTIANHDAAVLFVFPLASTGDATFVYDGTNWVLESVGLASGTYTPTLNNTTNVAASTAYSCQFIRTGNVVTVSGRVDVDPTAAGAVLLGISLPFASNLANANECAGSAAASGIAGQSAAISGDAANDRASMQWVAVDVTNQPMFFTFTYRVI